MGPLAPSLQAPPSLSSPTLPLHHHLGTESLPEQESERSKFPPPKVWQVSWQSQFANWGQGPGKLRGTGNGGSGPGDPAPQTKTEANWGTLGFLGTLLHHSSHHRRRKEVCSDCPPPSHQKRGGGWRKRKGERRPFKKIVTFSLCFGLAVPPPPDLPGRGHTPSPCRGCVGGGAGGALLSLLQCLGREAGRWYKTYTLT